MQNDHAVLHELVYEVHHVQCSYMYMYIVRRLQILSCILKIKIKYEQMTNIEKNVFEKVYGTAMVALY